MPGQKNYVKKMASTLLKEVVIAKMVVGVSFLLSQKEAQGLNGNVSRSKAKEKKEFSRKNQGLKRSILIVLKVIIIKTRRPEFVVALGFA